MSRVPPGQKRDRMTVDSGMALDSNDERYDVTEWRKRTEAHQTSGNALVGVVDADGHRVAIDTDGQMHVVLAGNVDAANSSNTILAAGEAFTGTPITTLQYAMIVVSVYSDVASAADGLVIEFSEDPDEIDGWHWSDTYTVPADVGKTYSFQTAAKYFRVRYINGDQPQTHFALSTILKKAYTKPSSHRIQDTISTDDDAELVKAVITGQRPNSDFVNFAATRNGNFKVAVEEFGDTPSIDSFARLRVSNPETLFDSKQLHDSQPLFWDTSVGGGASATHVPADACTRMEVTAADGDFVIRQTKQRFNYLPGKSSIAFMTFYMPTNGGTVARVGQFCGTGTNNLTACNGIWLENNEGDLYFKVAKDGTTTEAVIQANWNVDPLDGTGPSGVTLDMSAPQILIFDYEWLGVGRIRMGFVIGGVVLYAHNFNHANDPAFTSVYMTTPNNPLRYDLQGSASGGGTLDHICSTLISEGGQQVNGLIHTIDSSTTALAASSANTTYAVLGMRLKSTHVDITVKPIGLSLIATTNNAFRWTLRLNPTVAGTFTYGDLANSSIQYATGVTANTVTGGELIAGGYASQSTREASEAITSALALGSTIAGVLDTFVLCVTPLNNNTNILGSVTFRELL
jgi:hypothetical protein